MRTCRHPERLLPGGDLHSAGRLRPPIVIPPELLSQIDAVVASWLPGREGRDVSDVLFGRREFIGRLPVTCPRSVDQEPINIGDADYDPLSRFGHGPRL